MSQDELRAAYPREAILVEKANAVDCGNYEADSYMIKYVKGISDDWFDLAYTMFKVGFLKGQRAEKAKRIKGAKA